jgi:uncharacterized coiled-coil protein SlyX
MCDRCSVLESKITSLEETIEELKEVIQQYQAYIETETEIFVHAIQDFQYNARGTPHSIYHSKRSRAEFSDLLIRVGQEYRIR